MLLICGRPALCKVSLRREKAAKTIKHDEKRDRKEIRRHNKLADVSLK